MALVKPLLKQQGLDHNTFNNYRPVSNLMTMSKLLERVVHHQMANYLFKNSLMDPRQSAYRPGHSTETALLTIYNDIASNIDKGMACLFVALDLSAAFDLVDHSQLLRTIKTEFGIKGTVLQWFSSYLTDRKEMVCIRSYKSKCSLVSAGVPQGSILGPTLFSMYTTSLGGLLRRHNVFYHMYADDTQIYMFFDPKNERISDVCGKMSACLDDVNDWMKIKQLKLNQNKTEIMLVGSPNFVQNCDVEHINVNGVDIKMTNNMRSLGVKFDRTLSMDGFISDTCRKSFYMIRTIRKIRPFITNRACQTLVHAHITSRLDYCNSLLTGSSQEKRKRLQRVQNAAARLMGNTNMYDHITPILKDLHWLPVQARVHYKMLLFVYKTLKCSNQPEYLCDLIKPYSSIVSLRSNEMCLLEQPRYVGKYGAKSFVVAAPKLWNELPLTLKQAPSITCFKKDLKTFYFRRYFKQIRT